MCGMSAVLAKHFFAEPGIARPQDGHIWTEGLTVERAKFLMSQLCPKSIQVSNKFSEYAFIPINYLIDPMNVGCWIVFIRSRGAFQVGRGRRWNV
jgi:hypothetical protein